MQIPMKKLVALIMIACTSLLWIGTVWADDEKVTLKLLTRMSGTANKQTLVWKELIKEFEKKYPNVTISDESIAAEAAFIQKYKTMFATGDAYDFMNVDGGAGLQQYADAGIFMNVEPIMAEDPDFAEGYPDGFFGKWRYVGTEGTYALPHYRGAEVFFYHPDLLEKAGIDQFPVYWEDMLSAIKKLNAINVTPIALSGTENWRGGHIHNPLLYKWLGVDYVKELGARKHDWNSPEVVETLQFALDLKEAGAFPKNGASWNYTDEQTCFLEKKCAMIWNGPWMIPKIIDANQAGATIKAAGWPNFKSKPQFHKHGVVFTGGYQLNGRATGLQKKWGIIFGKFIMGKYAQQKFLDLGHLVARNDVDFTNLSQEAKDVNAVTQTIEFAGGDSFNFDKSQSMQNITRDAIQGMLWAGMSAQDAADQIQYDRENE